MAVTVVGNLLKQGVEHMHFPISRRIYYSIGRCTSSFPFVILRKTVSSYSHLIPTRKKRVFSVEVSCGRLYDQYTTRKRNKIMEK